MKQKNNFMIVKENDKFKIIDISNDFEVIVKVTTKEEAEKVLANMTANKNIRTDKEKVWRYDYEVISDKFIDKSTGFLKIPATVTRTGVFIYRKNDGSELRELRLPEDVFKKDSLDSLKNKPVTNNHPSEMVTLDNAKELMIGHVSDTVYHDHKFVNTDVIINDKAAIPTIENGKKQLSAGYTVDLEFKSGVYQGEKYDAIQRNIVYNHVAVVDKARAGREACLRLDSNDAEMISADINIKDRHKDKEKNMKKIKIDGVEIEVQDEVAVAFEAAVAKGDDLTSKIADMEKDTTKKDEMETLQAKLDASEGKVKDLETKLDEQEKVDPIKEAVKTRIDILKVAEKVCDANTVAKFDDMEDLDIKKATLKSKDSELNLDEKSDVYIDARFDILKEEIIKADGTSKLGEKIIEGRKDDSVLDVDKARTDSQKSDVDAWKTPCSVTNVKS